MDMVAAPAGPGTRLASLLPSMSFSHALQSTWTAGTGTVPDRRSEAPRGLPRKERRMRRSVRPAAESRRKGYLKFVAPLLAVGFLLTLAPPAAAVPILCYKCTYILFVGLTCDSSLEGGESGKRQCNNNGCILTGLSCTAPPGGGGGGGGDGDGGGGGGACGSTGFCPAECFTCPGGGGRPPV